MITQKYARRIFPCYGRTGFNLCPGDLRMHTFTHSSLGDKIIDAAFTLFISRIPILHGGIFYFRIVEGDDLYDGCMQLILITHGSSASFHVTHIAAFIGDDEGSFKLPCIRSINAEIGG